MYPLIWIWINPFRRGRYQNGFAASRFICTLSFKFSRKKSEENHIVAFVFIRKSEAAPKSKVYSMFITLQKIFFSKLVIFLRPFAHSVGSPKRFQKLKFSIENN